MVDMRYHCLVSRCDSLQIVRNRSTVCIRRQDDLSNSRGECSKVAAVVRDSALEPAFSVFATLTIRKLPRCFTRDLKAITETGLLTNWCKNEVFCSGGLHSPRWKLSFTVPLARPREPD